MLFRKKESLTGACEYLIVGLGNPGSRYEATRHNAGFRAVDILAGQAGVQIRQVKWKALLGQAELAGRRCLLMKPQTFMNNSGESVRDCAAFYQIPPENIIVLYDDISLDVGKMRIRRKGSAGGHNGIKSIIFLLNSDQFPRIKIGVGQKPHPDYDLAAWVLSRFTPEEEGLLLPVLEQAAQAAALLVDGQIETAMARYNS